MPAALCPPGHPVLARVCVLEVRDPVDEPAENPMPEVEVRETRRLGVTWVDRVFFDTTNTSFVIDDHV